MSQVSHEDRQILDALRRAVGAALDRKRRLGQYAVVWRNGKPVMIGADADKTSPTDSGTAGPNGRTSYDSSKADGQ